MNEITNTTANLQPPQWLDFTWLTELSAAGIVFVFVVVFGYALRRIERVDNRWLMALVPVAAAIYALIAPTVIPTTAPLGLLKNVVLKTVIGFVLGCFGVLIVSVAHDKLLAALAARWPLLSLLVNRDALEAPDKEKKENNEKEHHEENTGK